MDEKRHVSCSSQYGAPLHSKSIHTINFHFATLLMKENRDWNR
jgi:hypothetical protein